MNTGFLRNHRRRLAWLAAVILAAALFITVLPELMRYGAMTMLERQGAKHVSIEDIDFNPFKGTFELRRLETASGLKLDHVKLRLDWWPLWRQRLRVTELEADQLHLTLSEKPDGTLMIGHITMPTATESSEDEPPTLRLSLPEANLSHITLTINLMTSKGEAARTIHLSLDNLHLQMLSLSPKEIALATLRLSGLATDDSAGLLPKSIRSIALTNLYGDPGKSIKLEKADIDTIMLAPPAPLQGGGVKRIAAKGIELTADGDLSVAHVGVDKIALPDSDGTHLGSIDDIELGGVQLRQLASKPLLEAQRVTLANITLPADEAVSLGRIKNIRADALQADTHHAAMQSLTLSGLNGDLLRRKDGAIAIPKLSPTKSRGKSRADPFTLRIGTLAMSGNNRLSFRDESIKPTFKSSVDIRRFSLAPLVFDTSGKGKPKKGKLAATLVFNRQTTLTTDGSLTPGPARFALDLHTTVKDLHLPRLSSYAERMMDVSIQTGKLDLDSQARMARGALDSQNSLHIRNLQVTVGKNAPSAGGMPISMALAVVQDDNGDIHLKVPLSGKLDELKVGIDDAVNQALMKALQKASLYYAAQFLYPYGAIIPVYNAIKGMAMAQPALSPMPFTPGSDKLDKTATAYSDKIAALLKAKPGIRLQVCGITATAEFTTDNKKQRLPNEEKLLDLARQRSTRVVNTITAQGVDPERLFACKPEIDRATDAKGRVELLLQ